MKKSVDEGLGPSRFDADALEDQVDVIADQAVTTPLTELSTEVKVSELTSAELYDKGKIRTNPRAMMILMRLRLPGVRNKANHEIWPISSSSSMASLISWYSYCFGGGKTQGVGCVVQIKTDETGLLQREDGSRRRFRDTFPRPPWLLGPDRHAEID